MINNLELAIIRNLKFNNGHGGLNKLRNTLVDSLSEGSAKVLVSKCVHAFKPIKDPEQLPVDAYFALSEVTYIMRGVDSEIEKVLHHIHKFKLVEGFDQFAGRMSAQDILMRLSPTENVSHTSKLKLVWSKFYPIDLFQKVELDDPEATMYLTLNPVNDGVKYLPTNPLTVKFIKEAFLGEKNDG